jgi:hypothetical protein
LQAWAAAQLAEFQRSAHEETIAAQYAEYLAEQFQAQMEVRALQEKQDALAAAALAAAEYEQNNNHEHQVRREEELRQQAEDEWFGQQQAANQGQRRIVPKSRRPYHEPSGGPE